MEYEVRYYFNSKKYQDIINKLNTFEELKSEGKYFEKTYQFDHPDSNMSFYSKEIDGRFRVRITKSDKISKCKVSWKRRLNFNISSEVNKEEEVELDIKYEEYENLMFIINNVLKMKSIESYERYRTLFVNDDVEIAVDEYPFGVALEIENKSKFKNPEEIVKKWVQKLGFDIDKAYHLSWDDKYNELCKSQGIKQYNHVTFNLPMPEVMD